IDDVSTEVSQGDPQNVLCEAIDKHHASISRGNQNKPQYLGVWAPAQNEAAAATAAGRSSVGQRRGGVGAGAGAGSSSVFSST
ncbi:hypothetical protein CFP56_009486, partial [Quercus suber]